MAPARSCSRVIRCSRSMCRCVSSHWTRSCRPARRLRQRDDTVIAPVAWVRGQGVTVSQGPWPWQTTPEAGMMPWRGRHAHSRGHTPGGEKRSPDGYALRSPLPQPACLLWSCARALDRVWDCRQTMALRGIRRTIVTVLGSLRHRPCPRAYPQDGGLEPASASRLLEHACGAARPARELTHRRNLSS